MADVIPNTQDHVGKPISIELIATVVATVFAFVFLACYYFYGYTYKIETESRVSVRVQSWAFVAGALVFVGSILFLRVAADLRGVVRCLLFTFTAIACVTTRMCDSFSVDQNQVTHNSGFLGRNSVQVDLADVRKIYISSRKVSTRSGPIKMTDLWFETSNGATHQLGLDTSVVRAGAPTVMTRVMDLKIPISNISK